MGNYGCHVLVSHSLGGFGQLIKRGRNLLRASIRLITRLLPVLFFIRSVRGDILLANKIMYGSSAGGDIG